jgi:hypothetical protein
LGQIESALKKIIVRNKTTVTTSERTGRSRLLMTLNPTRIVHHRRRKELLTMVGGKRKLSTSELVMLVTILMTSLVSLWE